MDRQELYDVMSRRKDKPKDYEPYAGDNGRVNKCATLMRQGKVRTGGALVDVGGGIGDLGYAVRDLFDERVVIDICDRSNAAARAKGNTTYVCDIDRLGLSVLSDEYVDVVTALDFIEHIVDPENFARECRRVLKPGGEVFLNTPNIQMWRHLESQVLHGIFPHTSGDREVYHGGHLSFLNYNDICVIFEPAGFSKPEQFMDEECYEHPPQVWIDFLKPRSQIEYQTACLRLGCPNLLVKLCKK